MICAFGCCVMPNTSNNFWVVEFLIFFAKIKNCLFILMDSRGFKIQEMATQDLLLWLLGDAAHEQQFLGFRVSYFFAKVKNCLFVLMDSISFIPLLGATIFGL